MANNRKFRDMQKYRTEGIVYAYSRIKEIGLEEFEKERNLLGAYKIHMDVPKEYIEENIRTAFKAVQERVYATMRTIHLWSIHEEFGFGEKRLRRLNDKVNEVSAALMDSDPWQNPYLKFTDMAEDLKERCGLDFTLETIHTLNSVDQANDEVYMREVRRVELQELYSMLAQHGYYEALELVKKEELLNFGDMKSYEQYQEQVKEIYGKEEETSRSAQV